MSGSICGGFRLVSVFCVAKDRFHSERKQSETSTISWHANDQCIDIDSAAIAYLELRKLQVWRYFPDSPNPASAACGEMKFGGGGLILSSMPSI